jgi:hypothetical protein
LALSLQIANAKAGITLDFGGGERAMLVKDNMGDFGVVIGKWTGYRKGVSGTPGKA